LSIERFLKQRAINIAVSGSYTLRNWYDSRGKLRTFACRTTRVSPFRMMVEVPVVGKLSHRLTSYFPDLGKFDGIISDIVPGGILVELEMSASMRKNFANRLTWLENKQKRPTLRNLRKDERIIPENPHSSLTFANGSIHGCFIIDVSASGAAVSAEVQPPIGMPLAIGSCIGRVIRLLPNGFAVQFVERQNRNDLARLIAPQSLRVAGHRASDMHHRNAVFGIEPEFALKMHKPLPPPCPTCKVVPKFVTTVLDGRTGEYFQRLECPCSKHAWISEKA
jgi:hypothetical protein